MDANNNFNILNKILMPQVGFDLGPSRIAIFEDTTALTIQPPRLDNSLLPLHLVSYGK